MLRLKGDLAERVMKTAAQIEYREALNLKKIFSDR